MGIMVVSMDEAGAVAFATSELGVPREKILGVTDHGLANRPEKYKADARTFEVVLKTEAKNARRLSPEVTPKGRVSFDVTTHVVSMTEKGYRFLRSVQTGRFAHGSKVGMARTLEKMGLVTVEDNGSPGGRNQDGQRYWVERTELGRLVCSAE